MSDHLYAIIDLNTDSDHSPWTNVPREIDEVLDSVMKEATGLDYHPIVMFGGPDDILNDTSVGGPGEEDEGVISHFSRCDLVILILNRWGPAAGYHIGLAAAHRTPVLLLVPEAAENISVQMKLPILRVPDKAFSDVGFVRSLADHVRDVMRLAGSTSADEDPPSIFVSYSHVDREALGRVMVHIRPLERSASINVWSDRDLVVGSDWRSRIREEIDKASFALMLVSADFLASDFIASDELPPILEAAEQRGLTVVSLVLGHCRYARTPELARYQSANNPSEPYYALSESDRDEVLDALASSIEKAIA